DPLDDGRSRQLVHEDAGDLLRVDPRRAGELQRDRAGVVAVGGIARPLDRARGQRGPRDESLALGRFDRGSQEGGEGVANERRGHAGEIVAPRASRLGCAPARGSVQSSHPMSGWRATAMKAVLMAGGEGSRLRPLTIVRPKSMVFIVNKPVMEHVLDLLKRHGITDVIVTVQYLASVIQDSLGDGSQLGMRISYSVEEVPLGTAGSVKAVEDQLDETFIVISADALTDFDLGGIIDSPRGRHATATLTLYHVANPLEYGVVIIDAQGRIRQFLEKPSWGEVFSDTVNTGIYVLEPRIFDYFEAGKPVDFSQDVFPELLRQKDQLFGYVASGYWCDVGNIPEYMRANADLLQGKVKLGPIGQEIGNG